MNHAIMCAMEVHKNIECQIILAFSLYVENTVNLKLNDIKVNSSYMNAYSFSFSFFI